MLTNSQKMKKIIIVILFIVISLPAVYSQDIESLRKTVDSLFKTEVGDFAIAFKELSGKQHQLFIDEHTNFHAASTMKTPVMIEVFKQAKEGKFELSDSLTIKNEFKSITDSSLYSLDLTRDSGEQLYELIGKKQSIEDLVEDMIINSSNLATNIIIELVGADNVNRTMRQIGAKNINVLRGVEDMKAYQEGLNNSTTAYDLMLIFEHLGRGKAVDPSSSKKMINILFQQNHRDLIPALLPATLKIANKTGWIDGVHHDSALIFLPDDKKYVLVLLSKNMEDMEKGTKMLSSVSKLIYDYVAK